MAGETIALLGVVLGGLISFLTASVLERQRSRREDATRWLNTILDACAEYAMAVKEVARHSHWAFQADRMTAEYEALVTDLAKAELRRSLAFERVVLLVSDQSREKAAYLNDCVWAIEKPARGGESIDEAEWRIRRNRWVDALNDFHRSIRQDIGIVESKRATTWRHRAKRAGKRPIEWCK